MWPTLHLPFCYFPIFLCAISLSQIVLFATRTPLALTLPSDEWRWTSFTALFAHSTEAHLLANLFSQLCLGVFLEGVHGHGRFLIVYFASGYFGVLTFRALWGEDRGVEYTGCSPAVFGILGAYTSHLVLNWSEVKFRYTWLSLCALVLFVEVLAYQLSPLPNVAYSSHLGGCVFGVLVGVVVLKNPVVKEHERFVRSVCAFVAGVAGLALLME